MAGIAPVSNKVFSSFCFDDGVIDVVSVPGYGATYENLAERRGATFATFTLLVIVNEVRDAGFCMRHQRPGLLARLGMA